MKLTPEIIKKLEENLSKVENYEDLMSENRGIRKILESTFEDMFDAVSNNMSEKTDITQVNSQIENIPAAKENKLFRKRYNQSETGLPDENSSFKTAPVKKFERNLGAYEERIISLYGRGLTAGEIQNRLNTVFGKKISIEVISEVIDSIAELIKEWQNRPLEKMYVLVYFDTIQSNVKDQGKIILKTAYTCVGIDIQGHRDLLGIWVTSPGETNFWKRVLTEIYNRGTEDVLIASVENVKSFSEASKEIFPECMVQKCILPQLRSTLQYVATKDMKEFTHNLKEVYYSPQDENEALLALNTLEEKWLNKYKPAIKPWRDNWNDLAGCFLYPNEIRKMINSTNAFEVFHNQLDKTAKIKNVFQNDNALIEILFLACRNISKKWGKYPIKNWKPILAQLSYFFEDRVKAYL